MSARSGRSRVLPRSRLGCKTCKIRRVKCGEERPICVRCSSTGRKCDFEITTPPRLSNIANPLSLLPNAVSRERRAFAYYFEFAASSIGGGLDLDFWRTVVPQVCRSEPAVWDAIIAISALFESPKQRTIPFAHANSGVLSQNHQDALEWYSRSVSAIRQRIERGSVDIFVGLISCVLFICIEAIQGNTEGALRLYSQGVQLILTLRPQIVSGDIPASKASLLNETIIPIFVRLGAITPGSSGAPITTLLQETGGAPTEKFDSLRSAREAIVVLAIEIPLLESTCSKHLQQYNVAGLPQELSTRAFTLAARLRNWHIAFENLMSCPPAKNDWTLQQIGTAALLSSYHEMLYVMIETCKSLSLTQFDAYLPNFQNIVEQSAIALNASVQSDGTQPPFTFEISVGLPAWFTSLRCRDPHTRRAALALLHKAPMVQGFHQSSFGAAMSRKVMELEETQAMLMAAAYQHSNLGALESTHEPISGFELATSSHSAPKDPEHKVPTALLIPEEVRIGPIDVFRPVDGFLPGATERDVAKWNRSSDQPFLLLSRNEHDLTSNSLRLVYECVPLDF